MPDASVPTARFPMPNIQTQKLGRVGDRHKPKTNKRQYTGISIKPVKIAVDTEV